MDLPRLSLFDENPEALRLIRACVKILRRKISKKCLKFGGGRVNLGPWVGQLFLVRVTSGCVAVAPVLFKGRQLPEEIRLGWVIV